MLRLQFVSALSLVVLGRNVDRNSPSARLPGTEEKAISLVTTTTSALQRLLLTDAAPPIRGSQDRPRATCGRGRRGLVHPLCCLPASSRVGTCAFCGTGSCLRSRLAAALTARVRGHRGCLLCSRTVQQRESSSQRCPLRGNSEMQTGSGVLNELEASPRSTTQRVCLPSACSLQSPRPSRSRRPAPPACPS